MSDCQEGRSQSIMESVLQIQGHTFELTPIELLWMRYEYPTRLRELTRMLKVSPLEVSSQETNRFGYFQFGTYQPVLRLQERS